MKGSEFPFTVTCFFCLDVPNMVSFRLGLLSILVEPQNERLTPEVIADLMRDFRSEPFVSTNGTNLLHGYFFLWISLSGKLGHTTQSVCSQSAYEILTSSRKASVNACIRNLKGRKSGDSSSRCIFLAIKV